MTQKISSEKRSPFVGASFYLIGTNWHKIYPIIIPNKKVESTSLWVIKSLVYPFFIAYNEVNDPNKFINQKKGIDNIFIINGPKTGIIPIKLITLKYILVIYPTNTVIIAINLRSKFK